MSRSARTQQPGKPKPPGNPPTRPDRDKPSPVEEPPEPIPVPPDRDEPSPVEAAARSSIFLIIPR